MITKFEAVGIFLSIAAMAVALFLLRVDSSTQVLTQLDTQSQAASAIVVDDAAGEQAQEQAVADSLASADGIERMVIDDVKVGTGAVAAEGDIVRVHYIGRLENGQEFDNSYKRGAPFEFRLGAGEVIAGWDQGVAGMQEGGERILVIPPTLAYGAQAVGPIPPNAKLMFAIELLEVMSND